GGNDGSSVGSESKVSYVPATGASHERGMVNEIDEIGSTATLTTKIDYPSSSQTHSVDPRGVQTTTDLDAWDRPTHTVVSGPNLDLEEHYTYDANGRVKEHKRKQDDKTVTTTY